MRLTFTKRAGKYDELVIERGGQIAPLIHCPKQGIIPHDMVHYAVESMLGSPGFLGLIADGAEAAFTTRGGAPEEAVERLVEVFQAEMWGGRVSAAELIAVYEHSCDAHGHRCVPILPADVEVVRDRIDELSNTWSALSENCSLSLEM